MLSFLVSLFEPYLFVPAQRLNENTLEILFITEIPSCADWGALSVFHLGSKEKQASLGSWFLCFQSLRLFPQKLILKIVILIR